AVELVDLLRHHVRRIWIAVTDKQGHELAHPLLAQLLDGGLIEPVECPGFEIADGGAIAQALQLLDGPDHIPGFALGIGPEWRPGPAWLGVVLDREFALVEGFGVAREERRHARA